MLLTWMGDRLRAAGLTVVEMPGWKTRARPGPFSPTGLLFHATADKANIGTAETRDDAGAIGVIRDGRTDLRGPIAVAYVNRAGIWYLIAAGRCNTVKTGWGGPLNGLGNTHVVGVEAENNNHGEAWPEVQLQSLRVGFAVILRGIDQPVNRLAGHYEHQPKDKTDPFGINMNTFRRQVADVLAGKDTDVAISPQDWQRAEDVLWSTTNRTDATLANRPEAVYKIGDKTRREPNGLYAALLDLKSMMIKSAAREDAAMVALKALAADTDVLAAVAKVGEEVGELRAALAEQTARAEALDTQVQQLTAEQATS